jgi:hypothetical protein
MTVFAGTYTTHTVEGEREDLQDAIFDISPMDTPFVSSCSRGKATATMHQWQTDSLADATSSNAQIEGNDYTTLATSSPTLQVANYLQISSKTLAISGTLEAVDKAGRKSELAYQLAKRGKELKRDMETIVLASLTPNAGGATTARVMAPLTLWVNTNESRGTSGSGSDQTGDDWLASGGVPAVNDFSDGTQRALTETLFKSVLQSCWTNGADPNTLMVGAHNKQVASVAFDGVLTPSYDIVRAGEAKAGTAVGAVDVYVSDFGVIKIIPNRFQRARDAWVLDSEYYGLAFLRPMHTVKLAKTGDAEKRLLQVEYTLVVKNEAALGVVADLSTS